MTGFLTFLHAIICVLLVVIILMQSGRGGGLTEGFASAESMFGAQTNAFMIKATAIFASLFLVTCLSIAVLSAQKGRSLMSGTASKVEDKVEKQTSEIPTQIPEAQDQITDAKTRAKEAIDTVKEAIPISSDADSK
jgi:preprotein translocase subunit SecG